MSRNWDANPKQFWLNDLSEDVPPFACLELKVASNTATEVVEDEELQWNVKKPTADATANTVVFNGPLEVVDEASGEMQVVHLKRCLVDTSANTPEVGDELGPVDGEYYLGEGSGFVFQGLDASEAYVDGDIKSAWVVPGVSNGVRLVKLQADYDGTAAVPADWIRRTDKSTSRGVLSVWGQPYTGGDLMNGAEAGYETEVARVDGEWMQVPGACIDTSGVQPGTTAPAAQSSFSQQNGTAFSEVFDNDDASMDIAVASVTNKATGALVHANVTTALTTLGLSQATTDKGSGAGNNRLTISGMLANLPGTYILKITSVQARAAFSPLFSAEFSDARTATTFIEVTIT